MLRALQIAWRLGACERNVLLSEQATNALGAGIILVDTRGRILFANQVGERVLSAQRWMTVRGRRVEPLRQRDRKTFAEAVAAAAAGCDPEVRDAPGGIVSLQDSRGKGLNVFVATYRPAEAHFPGSQAGVLLQFTDPVLDNPPAAKALCEAFGVTQAEARLAHALARGIRIAEYARDAGISVNTAKTLLSRVFRKTGTARQSELVALLLSDRAFRLSLGDS